MKYSRLSLLVFCISLLCLVLLTQARRYHTKHKHNHHHERSHISQPPYSSPAPEPEPAPAPEPAEPPYNDGDPNNSSGVFDVRKFGAAGNGITDDTDAFKMAWDSACQSDSAAVILVPKGLSFMIQSTIFTGPCKGVLVFQVVLIFRNLFRFTS